MSQELAQHAADAYSSGRWVLLSGIALTALIGFLKSPKGGHVVRRVPRRWRFLVPTALSGIAAGLLVIAGEMPPDLAALLWPVITGVSMGAHSVAKSVRSKGE